MLLIIAVLLLLLRTDFALADCGAWQNTLKSKQEFYQLDPGQLAIVKNENFFTIRRGSCVDIGNNTQFLRFIINNHFEKNESSFVAAHIALVNFAKNFDVTYLFRNQKGGQWLKDKRTTDYSSTHNVSQKEFNTDLSGSESQFNQKYSFGSRVWNDAVVNDGEEYSTWSARGNFLTDSRFFDKDGVSIRTQNYLINFITRSASKPSGEDLDFDVSLEGASCAYIRLTGSPNVSKQINGTYFLAIKNSKDCEKFEKDFSNDQSLFAFLFGQK